MVPEWFDTLYAEAEYFLSRGINVTLKPQSDPTASKVVDGYTAEQLAILHNGMPQRDFTFNAFNFNNFKDWNCESGYRSIIIREPDGSIKRSYSCQDKPLGYIETGFKLFDKPMPCISQSCVSSADSKIPKTKPPHASKL